MLPLIVLVALVWVIKNATEDVMYASKGRPSPRQKFRQDRWAARQKRTGEDAPDGGAWWQRGPARRYAFDLWADSWADANTRRADRAADRRAAYAEARRQEQERAEQAERARQPVTAGAPTRPADPAQPTRPRRQPSPRPQTVPTDTVPTDTDPAGPTSTGVVHPCDGTYCTGCATCKPNAGTYGWNCGRCNTHREGFATEAKAQADADSHPCQIPTPTPEQLAEMFARPSVPEPASPTGPAATSTGGTMTGSTPEVSGHDSAKRYASGMAAASDAAVASLEQTVAAMTTGKVGAPAIAHLKQAQEHATQMSAALKQALAVLSRHDAVREGYASAPDAGDKEWMTRE